MHAAPTFGNPIGNLLENYRHRLGIVAEGIGEIAAGAIIGPMVATLYGGAVLLNPYRTQSARDVIRECAGIGSYQLYRFANDGIRKIDIGIHLINDPRSEAKDYL